MYGVPQGSPLRLMLCILHLNSLPSVISAVVNQFASDALVYSSSHNIPALVSNIQNELNTVTNWMTLNKLKINVEKSSLIIFGSTHKITIFQLMKLLSILIMRNLNTRLH